MHDNMWFYLIKFIYEYLKIQIKFILEWLMSRWYTKKKLFVEWHIDKSTNSNLNVRVGPNLKLKREGSKQSSKILKIFLQCFYGVYETIWPNP